MIFDPPHHPCYACAYLHKALLSLLFFPLMLVIIHVGLARGGATYLDLPYLIYSGQLVWWKQAIGWACGVIGVLRYMPPAWRALRHNLCLAWRDGDELVIHGYLRIPVAEIVGIRTTSTITRKGVYIYTKDRNRFYICTILAAVPPRVFADKITSDIPASAEPDQDEALGQNRAALGQIS